MTSPSTVEQPFIAEDMASEVVGYDDSYGLLERIADWRLLQPVVDFILNHSAISKVEAAQEAAELALRQG